MPPRKRKPLILPDDAKVEPVGFDPWVIFPTVKSEPVRRDIIDRWEKQGILKRVQIRPVRTTARDFFEMIIKVVDQRDATNTHS